MNLLDVDAADTFDVDDDVVKTIDDYLMTFLDVPLNGEKGQSAEIAISNLIVANVSLMITLVEQNPSDRKTAWAAVRKWAQRTHDCLAAIRQAGQPDNTS